MLNANEQKVFDALVKSSDGNGHDFGCLEDLTGVWGSVEGLDAQQVGGYITQLQTKGLIYVYDPHWMEDHGHTITQYKLTADGFRLAGLDPKDYL